MIFYKTSSFGNDFIEIDLNELSLPSGRRPLGGLASAMPRRPHGGLTCPQDRRPLGGSREQKDRQPHGGLPKGIGKGELARRLCDRQRGVGADGVVFFRKENNKFGFEIFNRDGGAAELSGNGMAGLAAVLLQRRLAASPIVLRTAVGRRRVELLERRGRCFVLDVEIGAPDFADRGFFPFLRGPRSRRPLGGLDEGQGPYRVAGVEFHPVAVGNPHAVVICRGPLEDAKLAALGEKIGGHGMFPKGVNVEFVRPVDDGVCRVYFYERGVGPTLASSTGSAAVFAVLRRLGLAKESLAVESGGDPVPVSWRDGIRVRNVTQLVCRGDFFL